MRPARSQLLNRPAAGCRIGRTPFVVRMEGGHRDHPDAFNARLQADGYWVFAGGLQPGTTATFVDGRASSR